MDVIEALNARHSVRAFKQEPIPKETIVKILEAAHRSPSTGNTQPWQIFAAGGEVLERIRQTCTTLYQNGAAPKPEIPSCQDWPPALKERMAQMRAERYTMLGIDRQDREAIKINQGLNYQFFGAPALLILCMDRTLGIWSAFDLGIVSQSIMLAAKNYGIDSIEALNFVAYPEVLRKELEIPDTLTIVIGIALGYADDQNIMNQYHSSRHPLEEAVSFKGI